MAGRTPKTTRRLGPYVPVSAFWTRDDAIIALNFDEDDLGELLFMRCLVFCAAEPRLDGFISDAALASGQVLRRRRMSRVLTKAERLVELGVLTREDGGYRITRWSKWNRTWDEIEEARAKDRNRKTSDGGDEPPEPPDPRYDRPNHPNGIHPESTRNPPGVHPDSLSRPRTGTRAAGTTSPATATATQPQQQQHRPAPPPPPLLPELTDLAHTLAAAGIHVAWELTAEEQTAVLAALDRCGISRLTAHARSRHQPSNPAFSARAFLSGWSSMPDLRSPGGRRERIPCDHGSDDARLCALCRHGVTADGPAG